MKIHYLLCGNKKRLFSFSRHHFNKWVDPDTKEEYFIDGGFDYSRVSGKHCEIRHDEISDVIGDIREQFMWTSTMDKDGNVLSKPVQKKLMELDSDHIENIINHINDIAGQRSNTEIYINILREELNHRSNNQNG